MPERLPDTEHVEPSSINRCWTSIGIYGDATCPELRQHVHCRNCPVYSAAATRVLDGDAPADYVAGWTSHIAQPKPLEERDTQSVVIFRVGSEWFALPTARVTEVVNVLPIHSLPHRTGGIILGLASVRGELLICIALGQLLRLEVAVAPPPIGSGSGHRRLLVIRRDHVRAVCPVDEVHGIHRFHPRELKDAPSTVARAATTYSRALLPWRERSVGLLDDERLFDTVMRSVV
jgi:chemotaxis-related protein WspD